MAFQLFVKLSGEFGFNELDQAASRSYTLADAFLKYMSTEKSTDPETSFYKSLLNQHPYSKIVKYNTQGDIAFYCTPFKLFLSNGVVFSLGPTTKEILLEAMEMVFDTPEDLAIFF